MTKFYSILIGGALVISAAAPGRAGTESTTQATTASGETKAVPLDLFTIQSGYVFESDLNHGGSLGKQDEIQNEIEYGHRIQLKGNLYLHLGFSYDRYDFGSTPSPVPNHLQTISGVVGVDYMHGEDVGAFLEFRPGFYAQNHFGISSFDVPISFGRIFVIKQDKFYLFAGGYAAFLADRPFLPLPGVIWIISDKLRLMGVAPDPRLIYSPSKKIDLWLGGEFVGGSFRTDHNPGIQPGKLRGAQVDFLDVRAGVGVKYDVNDHVSLDLSGGCSIQRQFDFGRAGETYRTDPAPYVTLKMSAAF